MKQTNIMRQLILIISLLLINLSSYAQAVIIGFDSNTNEFIYAIERNDTNESSVYDETLIEDVYEVENFNSVILINNDYITTIKINNATFNIHFKYNDSKLDVIRPKFNTQQMYNIDDNHKAKIIELVRYELEKYPINSLQYLPTEFYITDLIKRNGEQYNGLNLSNIVYLNCIDLNNFTRTFHHEIFHTFANLGNYNSLEQNIKTILTTNIRNNSHYEDGFVSAYARTSTEEDLAETFTVLMNSSSFSTPLIDYVAANPNSSIAKKYNKLVMFIQNNISTEFNYNLFNNISNNTSY